MASSPRPSPSVATDWSSYYESVPATARLTRRFTARMLVRLLRRTTAVPLRRPIRVLEIGGANSCFAADFLRQWPGLHYHVVDMNEAGLDMFRDRFSGVPGFTAEKLDVLDLAGHAERLGAFDIVYSVGLVEHFDSAGTAQAVRAHFALAHPTGTVLISYPTPTPLYRFARGAIEAAGAWKFPDERPLSRMEVVGSMPPGWLVANETTLWPLILTQHMMLFVRTADGQHDVAPAAFG